MAHSLKLVLAGSLALAACGGQSGTPSNPYSITGQVVLGTSADGGAEVRVYALVTRYVDGGVEVAADAGVALNGEPLGPSNPLAAEPQVDALLGFQAWSMPSWPGAGPLQVQTLSVVGANPPMSLSFACPALVAFTSPAPNATLDASQPVTLTWSTAGSTRFAEPFSYWLYNGSNVGGTRGQVLDAGTTSTTFSLSDSGLPLTQAAVSFDILVTGETAFSDSNCQSDARLPVTFR